jgi:membrane-bound lytic murein transglycosylase D
MLNKRFLKYGTLILVLFIIGIFISFKIQNKAILGVPEYLDEYEEVTKVSIPGLPKNPKFCDEILDLSDPNIHERLDRELTINTFLHSSTILLIKKANRYFPMIEKILKEEKVPDDMKYLCVAESALSPAVSPSGAAGFWQFMEATAKEYGMLVNEQIDERYNIEKSTRAACAYLKKSYKELGTWSLAAAAYNAGKNGINNQIQIQNQNDYFNLHLNTETSRYVFRIVALKYILTTPIKYGYAIKEEQLYKPIDYNKLEVTKSRINWITFCEEYGISYKTLKYHNPQIRQIIWENKTQNTIEILIPKN